MQGVAYPLQSIRGSSRQIFVWESVHGMSVRVVQTPSGLDIGRLATESVDDSSC